jgi:ubiquinone biosynthesis monooxygenase Coq7
MSYAYLFTLHNPLKKCVCVDHAGEVGAVEIYKAQIKALKYRKYTQEEYATALEMLDGEMEHLDYFCQLIKSHHFQPTIFLPIWTILARFMGFTTAILGSKHAHTCTQAVEDVIEKHYAEQILKLTAYLEVLSELERVKIQSVIDKITQFRLEEMEHAQTAMKFANEPEKLTYYLVQKVTKLAIKLTIF